MSWGNRDQPFIISNLQRTAAWILVVVAIVFWLWFGIGSAMVEGRGWFNWFMHMLIPGGLFVFSAFVALRWQLVGGMLFTILGVLAVGVSVAGFLREANALGTTVMMLITLALPPLFSGFLFLVDARGGGVESGETSPN